MNNNDFIKCRFAEFETPLGNMIAISEPDGIIALDFRDSCNPESAKQFLTAGRELCINENWDENLLQVKKEISEYFSGVRREFHVRLCFHGTDFQKKVWKELMKIPYGITRTYKEQAIALNDIKAIRAVASANGKNKIAIIVPCHRVIGSDGSLTGYAGGLWRKKYLLDFESDFENPNLFKAI